MLKENIKNYIFIGGSGGGKTEISINTAIRLATRTDRKVHFFDLDQTKPLFRARDVRNVFEEYSIYFHCEEQFFDVPAQTGGVPGFLADETVCTVLDVGGNNVGARLIGGFSPFFRREDTVIYYVINPYRPWSENLESVDKTLLSVLAAARIDGIEHIKILCNPNIGFDTTEEDFLSGMKKIQGMFASHGEISATCIYEPLLDVLREKYSGEKEKVLESLIPIKLYLSQPYI